MRTLFLLVSMVAFFCACSPSQKSVSSAPRPSETPTIQSYSTDLVLHYKLYKSGITDTFNRSIAESLKGPFDFSSYGIDVIVTKAGTATVEIQGKTILVIAPVAVQVVKKTFLTDMKAKGVMEMSFVSDIEIDSMWRLTTRTRLRDHRWTEPPVLSVAGLSIPIETLSNAVVNKSKGELEKSIDETVRENFQLRAKIKETMKLFEKPLLVDSVLQASLIIQPERCTLNRLKNERTFSSGKISFTCRSLLTTGQPPAPAKKEKIPPLTWSESIGDSSIFRLIADIRSDELTRGLQKSMVGQTFRSDGKSITVKKVEVSFLPGLITVATDVTGSFKGTVIIEGKPIVDAKTNSVLVDVTDIRVKTKNLFHKAAAWLAEGKIRSEMEKKLQWPLNEQVTSAQKTINEKLVSFNRTYNLDLKVGLGKSTIESLELSDGRMTAFVRCPFYLSLGIQDFRSFQKF